MKIPKKIRNVKYRQSRNSIKNLPNKLCSEGNSAYY